MICECGCGLWFTFHFSFYISSLEGTGDKKISYSASSGTMCGVINCCDPHNQIELKGFEGRELWQITRQLLILSSGFVPVSSTVDDMSQVHLSKLQTLVQGKLGSLALTIVQPLAV